MSVTLTDQSADRHQTYLKLARAIAMDVYPVEKLLEQFKLSTDEWEKLQASPWFTSVLESEVADWAVATNTLSRIKIKSGVFYEEWLPEAYRIVHDKTEPLSGRVEVMKLVASTAGVGKTATNGSENPAEGLKITINLGADAQLMFEKHLPTQVIEGEIVKDDGPEK